MKSLFNYLPILGPIGRKTLYHKTKDRDYFIETYGEKDGDYLYNKVKNAKSGLIKVYKISDNPGIEKGVEYFGVTTTFGEGLGLYIDNIANWFRSSVIQKIDWDKSEFMTLNSVYHFEFDELDETEALDYYKKLEENDSKSKD